MNIVFICGALEPGHDGVGDYTLKLAGELQNTGHKVSILALYDWYVDECNDQGYESVINCIDVLRLSSDCSGKRRFFAAKEWIDRINPNWLSLQFVPFSFQRKGLPFRLGYFLNKVGTGRRYHIMFHELWVGMPVKASKKHIFWGWLQQQIIRLLMAELKPLVVHTQCRLYLAQLVQLGFRVSHLPLFSNIPVVSSGMAVKSHESNNKISPFTSISLIIFGTIHPQAFMRKLIEQVSSYKQRHTVQFKLILAGKCGSYQDKWISASRSAGIEVTVLGEQTQEEISAALSRATIGVTTSALPMVDKSGTVAAMLEHKLPVICVGHSWTPRGVQSPARPPGIYLLEEGCIEACLIGPGQVSNSVTVSETAKQLVDELALHK